MLKKRQKMIEIGIEKASAAQELFEKTEAKEKVILKKAQETATKIIAEVKEQRNTILKEAEIQAKNQAERIIKEAQEHITYEAKETEKRLAKHIAELSISILQKSLIGVFSKREQDVILKNALTQIKKKTN
jgi:F-type H+-transporting ATPase subunit b